MFSQYQDAHQKLQAAIDNGELVRPKKCSKCKQAKKVYGHHEDYSEPLKVVWLCATCHNLAHFLKERHPSANFPHRSTFGKELRKHRLEVGMSLNELASRTNYGVGNWSKVENGLISPPKDATVTAATSILGINTQHMLDLAAVNKGRLPKDIASDPELRSAMPAYFAKARKQLIKPKETHAKQANN